MEKKVETSTMSPQPSLDIAGISGGICCPLCGSENYQEYEELMYGNRIDDPQCGGELKMVKYGDCRDCG